jgi:hypothetical protein
MLKRLISALAVVALAITLAGCSKCGFWWDDWPKSCKDDIRK